jgi:protein tyrosine phosphatase (PTP) superfamily phosphohydrolase (DUF442 family)
MKLLDRLRWKPRLVTVRPLAIDLGLFVGSQLDKQGVEDLWRVGFRSIVNLAHEGEPGQILTPNIEASWAHTFELDHARLSIGDSPRSEEFERLCQLLVELPRPIYLHSTGGERARALGVACVARRRGWSGTQALREAESRAIRLRSGALKRFLLESLDSSVGQVVSDCF